MRGFRVQGSGSQSSEMRGSSVQGVQRGSLLQQPGPKKFKLSKIELIYKAEKFKVTPFTI